MGCGCNGSGYWFKEASHVNVKRAHIDKFLKDGSPPVYVGFGSAVEKDVSRPHQAVVRALEQAGARGVISYSHDNSAGPGDSERAFVIGETPHSWLFPRMVAIVHHGGSGTTGAALRAG